MKKIKLSFLLILISINLFSIDDYNEPVLHKLPENIFSERTTFDRDAPEGDEIVNPAEFGRVDGVFLAWAGWALDTITYIAREVAENDKVYMLVANYYYETIAYNHLSANNVNMDNVIFIHDSNISGSSMWIRDYFPFYIYEDGERGLIDFVYGTYQGDEYISNTIGSEFDLPVYDSAIIHHGGNHITDGNGMGFFSTNIFQHNPGYSQTEIRNEFKNYLGLDSLIVVEPMAGDGTGHIDMFCKLLNDTLFVVGEYATPEDSYPGDYDLLNELADYLETLQNLDGRDFSVERILMPPFTYGGPAGTINYTYTNSYIINNKVLVPIYGFDTDDAALQIYSELMPGYDIIGIDSAFIIQYWGAIHCIVNSHYSENPLIVLHEPIVRIANDSEPQIKFRVNPKFESAGASVFYKLESDEEFTEIQAELSAGIWRANLPAMTENFEYYIYGTSTSGETEFVTNLPENAPEDVFAVDVEPVSVEENCSEPEIYLTAFPNPFNSTTTISFSLTTVSTENTELNIYNLKGQKIKKYSIFNDQSSITWNGTDESNKHVSSGIYFYKLISGKKSSIIKKMILMR